MGEENQLYENWSRQEEGFRGRGRHTPRIMLQGGWGGNQLYDNRTLQEECFRGDQPHENCTLEE